MSAFLASGPRAFLRLLAPALLLLPLAAVVPAQLPVAKLRPGGHTDFYNFGVAADRDGATAVVYSSLVL